MKMWTENGKWNQMKAAVCSSDSRNLPSHGASQSARSCSHYSATGRHQKNTLHFSPSPVETHFWFSWESGTVVQFSECFLASPRQRYFMAAWHWCFITSSVLGRQKWLKWDKARKVWSLILHLNQHLNDRVVSFFVHVYSFCLILNFLCS